ncbi:MAG TPA: hypothetical protein DCQ98_09385 [Planctomycetaceae bacterium]|nr:hypothetical protein [Planctomycetaceae bacterium]
MARHSLTDEQWEMIEDILPARRPTGRRRMDHRAAFDAIPWILRTGAPLRDLPSEMGNWRTVYGHYDQ